jgi:hypothetical protein
MKPRPHATDGHRPADPRAPGAVAAPAERRIRLRRSGTRSKPAGAMSPMRKVARPGRWPPRRGRTRGRGPAAASRRHLRVPRRAACAVDGEPALPMRSPASRLRTATFPTAPTVESAADGREPQDRALGHPERAHGPADAGRRRPANGGALNDAVRAGQKRGATPVAALLYCGAARAAVPPPFAGMGIGRDAPARRIVRADTDAPFPREPRDALPTPAGRASPDWSAPGRPPPALRALPEPGPSPGRGRRKNRSPLGRPGGNPRPAHRRDASPEGRSRRQPCIAAAGRNGPRPPPSGPRATGRDATHERAQAQRSSRFSMLRGAGFA